MQIKPEEHEALYGLAKAIKEQLNKIDEMTLSNVIDELTPLMGLVEALNIIVEGIDN